MVNVFELFTAAAVSALDQREYKYTWLEALSIISFLTQAIFTIGICYKYKDIPKASVDESSNTVAGPQKERRRWKKIFGTWVFVISICQLITAFTRVSKGTFQRCNVDRNHQDYDDTNETCDETKGEQCGSGLIWLIILNGLWNLILSCYLWISTLTTLPIGSRVKAIRSLVIIAILVAISITSFSYQKRSNSSATKTVVNTMGMSGALALLFGVTIVVETAYSIFQAFSSR